MTFTWPIMLWALAALPFLIWSALAAGRRQRRAEARLADTHLLPVVAGRPRAGHRIPALLYLGAIALLTVAAARPVASIPLPVDRAALVIAVDTSQSMFADDIAPTRLDAARAGARTLIAGLPRRLRIGLVSFSDVGTILVPPTVDRRPLFEALDRLRPQQSTAVGSAVVESLQILPGRSAFLGERLSRLRTQAVPDPFRQAPPAPAVPGPPVTADDLPPAVIVVFSDGVTNAGIDPRLPATLAAEGRVTVHTVGTGREGGAVTTLAGRPVLVPFDASSLQALAQRTGGEYVRIEDTDALRRLAQGLRRDIGWERTRVEITAVLAGVAAALMITGAALSLAWSRRVP